MAKKRTKRVKENHLRPVRIRRNYTKHAEGSVLIEQGDTHVLCNASVEARVPPYLEGTGKGWVTAEYAMLPRSTHTRSRRESRQGGPRGRTQEISRLIGRSLRCAVDLSALGEHTITIDCDVLQADGGTRCASITGGMVALYDAIRWLKKEKLIQTDPVTHFVAAISVGLVDGAPWLDLAYEQDCRAEVDMNIVMTDDCRFVEIQGTAESEPFTDRQLSRLKKLAAAGIADLIAAQKQTLRVKR